MKRKRYELRVTLDKAKPFVTGDGCRVTTENQYNNDHQKVRHSLSQYEGIGHYAHTENRGKAEIKGNNVRELVANVRDVLQKVGLECKVAAVQIPGRHREPIKERLDEVTRKTYGSLDVEE